MDVSAKGFGSEPGNGCRVPANATEAELQAFGKGHTARGRMNVRQIPTVGNMGSV